MNIKLNNAEIRDLIREALQRRGLSIQGDDNDAFEFFDNEGQFEVEVSNVVVSARPARETVSLSQAAEVAEKAVPTKPGQSTRKSRPVARDEGMLHDESDEEIEKEIRRGRALPPPVKGLEGVTDPSRRQVRVGATLEDMGKDPTDMSDELNLQR